MRYEEFIIHDRDHLDEYIVKLAQALLAAQKKDSKYYGMVAAGVLDNQHNFVIGVNHKVKDGTRNHAERVAISNYRAKFGPIPPGSIINQHTESMQRRNDRAPWRKLYRTNKP